MDKNLKLRVYSKTKNKIISELENEEEIIIFDVFSNEYRILNLETGKFKNLPEDLEIYEYIGQNDYYGNEIYSGDKLELENGLKGTIRYMPEIASFQVFFDLDIPENEIGNEIYYDNLDVNEYKKILK